MPIFPNNFKTLADNLMTFINDPKNREIMQNISNAITDAFKNNRKVLICGNGGSACDAVHFAEEFTGRFRKNRPALPVIAISDSAHITCVGNDFGFDHIFSRAVDAYIQPGDILVGISTSGNSQNVINAFNSAKNKSALTFALLGKDGGKIKNTCDFELIIPGDTTDRIQEIHMLILHSIIEEVERQLFPELY